MLSCLSPMQAWMTVCSSTLRTLSGRRSMGSSCSTSLTRSWRSWGSPASDTRSSSWRPWTYSVLWWGVVRDIKSWSQEGWSGDRAVEFEVWCTDMMEQLYYRWLPVQPSQCSQGAWTGRTQQTCRRCPASCQICLCTIWQKRYGKAWQTRLKFSKTCPFIIKNNMCFIYSRHQCYLLSRGGSCTVLSKQG